MLNQLFFLPAIYALLLGGMSPKTKSIVADRLSWEHKLGGLTTTTKKFKLTTIFLFFAEKF
jgi:hypothetical protein